MQKNTRNFGGIQCGKECGKKANEPLRVSGASPSSGRDTSIHSFASIEKGRKTELYYRLTHRLASDATPQQQNWKARHINETSQVGRVSFLKGMK